MYLNRKIPFIIIARMILKFVMAIGANSSPMQSAPNKVMHLKKNAYRFFEILLNRRKTLTE